MEQTQYMVIVDEKKNLQTDTGNIKNTEGYDYQGVLLTNDGKDEKD